MPKPIKASTPTLHSFDGREVIMSTIAIIGAGDGLSQALSIDPREYHHGQQVDVVLRCEVTQVGFKPIKDTDRLERKHTLRAGIATIVDASLVEEVIEAQRVKIETAAGVQRIPFDDGVIDADGFTPNPE